MNTRALIHILADMVEAALDQRRALEYAAVDEEALPDLQEDVRCQDDVAEVLHPGVPTEGRPKAPKAGRR
jgi:hypothetical protein